MYWRFFEIPGIRRRALLAVFILKLIAGFGLAWLYTDHYENRRTGDAFRFYDDGEIMYSSLEKGIVPYAKLITGIGLESDSVAMTYYMRMTHLERPFYTGFLNDNATIIKANAVVMLFSQRHYHVHTVFWCFFAMIGLTAILKILIRFYPDRRNTLFLSVFLLPTVLFWGSGVLKEALLLMGLGLFLLGFFRYIMRESYTSDIVTMFIGFFILLIAKGYVLQCMAPAILGLLLIRWIPKKNFWLLFSLPHLAIVLLIFTGPHITDGLKISELMSLKQTAFYNVAATADSGSIIALPKINRPFDLILNAPQALVNTYLRPWPWEWSKPLYIPAALENLFLIFCFLLMLWKPRKPQKSGFMMLSFSLSFVSVLGVLTGEVVPVLGALVRYKLPALIFIFAVLFSLTDFQKIQKQFPILKKFHP
jgi:hypothetical protein